MVDRYEPTVDWHWGQEDKEYTASMEERDYGDYVRYEDYVALKEKYEKLCGKVTEAWWEVP